MNDYYYRLQRKVASVLMRRRFVGDGPAGSDKISLVLYFDYEREFGNPDAKSSAETGFCAITELLGRYNIRATWNCVGLIAEHYPHTLYRLVASQQELASHTYHHVDVTRISRQEIREELILGRTHFAEQFEAEVVGLHPPMDRYSMCLPQVLNSLGFRYLIARDDDVRNWHAHFLRAPFGGEVLCIPSIADDWGYVEARFDAEAMLHFWTQRIAKLVPGRVAAIGFHPWVLGADPSRMQGFADLLDRLVADKGVVLMTAREISDWYER